MTRPITTMKTAVSLPTELYEKLEVFRAERGLSRSGAVTEAIARYVSAHGEELTARIDAALGVLDGLPRAEDDVAGEAARRDGAERVFSRLDREEGVYPPPRAVRQRESKARARRRDAQRPARP